MLDSKQKSFWSLMVTQFFGAFNDNVLKVLVSLLIVQWVSEPHRRAALVDLSGAVFVAPFLIFSMLAGRLSDRNSKSYIVVATKVWELLVISVAILSLWEQSILWMMISLFLLSMQAAFFSPAKYGVLPELMSEQELSDANGLLNMGTFLAILCGTITGSFLSERLPVAFAIMAGASVLGLIASFGMSPLIPAKPEERLEWNPLKDLVKNWQIIRQDSLLRLGTIAVNYFWLMGAILQLNIFLYAREMMGASPQQSGMLLVAVALGIGIGSFLAGKFSRGKVELGLVPLGALGMSLFAMELLWAYPSYHRVMFDFFMLGMSGGFYEIPLAALIQSRSPAPERGRVLATVNFFSFVAILAASGVLWVLGPVARFNPAKIFFIIGLVSLSGLMVVFILMPAILDQTKIYLKSLLSTQKL